MPIILAVALLAASCGSGSTGSLDAPPTDAPAASGGLAGTIVVSAASSLSAAFERIAEDFAAANPAVEVDLNLDGSSSLAAQVLEGAPVDVLATADTASLDRVADARMLPSGSQVFASNELVIVTSPGNPSGIRSLGDLDGVGIVALCGADVPCGRYAGDALSSAGVRLEESTVTRGRNAGATLAAVAQGDAVAAIVYATDAIGGGDAVTTVSIPEARNVVVTYPIGVVSTGSNLGLAQAFVDWVVGPAGQAVLAQFGFGRPP